MGHLATLSSGSSWFVTPDRPGRFAGQSASFPRTPTRQPQFVADFDNRHEDLDSGCQIVEPIRNGVDENLEPPFQRMRNVAKWLCQIAVVEK